MMRSRIIVLNLLAVFFLTVGLGLSYIEDAEAADVPSQDVHGISYSTTSSSLQFAITDKDGQSFSYPVVDWYIYGTGTASYDDGTVSRSFEVDGLKIFRMEYQPGTSVPVTITVGDETYSFDLSVRSNTSYVIVDEEDIIEIGTAELSSRDVRNITIGAAVIVLGFFAGLFFARRAANRGDQSI
jgi:hypothetical protein